MSCKGPPKLPILTLGALADWSGGTAEFTDRQRCQQVGTVWHDSRKVKNGDVFVAIKTDNNDGHSFITDAFATGALAAIVDKNASVNIKKKYRNRLIRVADPLKAIGKAAQRFRKEMGILMVGVTGSNGKTTTRSFISKVLQKKFSVGETWSNWNNHIGVPLSVLKFRGDEWVGVLEMGANHKGEISGLSKIVSPDIGVITNIGYAHVGLFGSLADIVDAKFELTDGLNKKKGFLLLNGDDHRLYEEARKQAFPSIFFGFKRHCSVRAENIKVDREKGVSFDVDGYEYTMAMPGRHFIYSALPAVFLGRRCGISDDLIASALAEVKPVEMRGTVRMKAGVNFIVDCYNANPSSMKSALTYLEDIAGRSRKVAIVGDMLELGRYAKRQHRKLGEDIVRAGVRKLIAVGDFASCILEGAFEAGMSKRSMVGCDTADSALTAAEYIIRENDTVLLKGSRGVHLESVFTDYGK
jgi:UDP-N-acetylmuramoyl-tripeptide--D-alanyl-D-alanine ligase